MEDILNKKNTSYGTFCYVCLSRDRRLFSIEKYANIFQNICEGKFTSQTLLCWECTAVLRRIKQFKEKVELSTKILNKYVNRPVHHFNSLSNLKITENEAIIKYEECEKVNNIKVEIVFNTSNNCNPIINKRIKQEFRNDDNDIVFNDTDSFENNVTYLEVKSEVTPTISDKVEVKREETPTINDKVEVKSEETSITSKRGKLKKKKQYRVIPNDVKDAKSLVRKVVLTAEEVKSYMDEQRSSLFYKNSAYRCEQCACSWNSESEFLQHNKKYHAKSVGQYQCDICLSRFKTNKDMNIHMQHHFVILECCTCTYRSHRDMKGHLESHHKKYECIKCNAGFSNIYLFYQHYKELHCMFICDICGKKTKSKRVIIKHIGRHFEKYECKLCDRKYKNRKSFMKHKENNHSQKTVDAYCVQCDKKYSNAAVYRDHLLRSAAHAAERDGAVKKVPCPDCGRQYTRRAYMKNHYRHVHMKQSKYYCEICNKPLLNRTSYLQHVQYKHKKVEKKKNKLCNICGRGFTENRTLNNHIRTHTGERPHECSYCGAKFIQAYAMRVHVNNVHLKNKRPNLK